MATKEVKAVAELDASGRSAIVRSVSDAVASIGKSGSFVTHVCDVARKAAGGNALSDSDMDDIIATVAKTDTLKAMEKATRANTLSRWRTVLCTYAQLPEAEKALREKVGRAAWHDVMALAVKLKGGSTIAESVRDVAARMTGKARGESEPTTAAEARKNAGKIIKRLIAMPKLSRDLIVDLKKLAADHDLAI